MPKVKEVKAKKIVAICGCGKELSASEIKGSIQQPYCAECYAKFWHDDDRAYMDWLATHD